MNKTTGKENVFSLKNELSNLVLDPKIILINAISFVFLAIITGTIATPMVLFLFILVNYGLCFAMESVNSSLARRQIYLGSALANVAVFLCLQHLGYISIISTGGTDRPATLPCLLGFAFYLLQVLAIQGAVYRGVIQKMKFQNYVLAVSFLGAFIAGPIFNGAQLKKMENIHLEFPTLDRIYQKLHFFIGAILFKYVFANWLAQWVSLNESLSPLMIARSVFCFELQVYFDFAAYSLFSYFFCYIFLVPMYHNFNEPFSARDIPEFWRRWHVGLGTFFKENVFLPLRTVFPGQISTQFILPILVFTLSAAWHGPTRNFLLWGLFHGLSFAFSVAILRSWRKFYMVRLGARIQMFVVIFYGRLLFMESDFERLMYKFRQLGMFKDMGREISVLLVAPTQVVANLWQHWDDTFIGLSIAAVLVNQIWFIPTHDGSCYRFLKPGAAAILLFILSLLFFQPHNNFGFVYGR